MIIRLREIKLIFLSFLGLIGVGALLLLMPFAHHGSLSWINALFTSTSAVCVTGLIVKDTVLKFTFAGQLIILVLIQIGGLGYMTAVTFLAIILNKKLDHKDRLILKESLNYSTMNGLVRFLKIVFLFTIAIETIGAAILSVRFSFDMSSTKAMWFGIFHSISAFNNAGFSLFNNNFMNYRHDLVINLVIPALIILGGIGYIVLVELYYYKKYKILHLSVNTKIVLIVTVFLLIFGVILLLSMEWNGAFKSMSWGDKILSAWFTSVNYRTAGFNTIDMSSLSNISLFFSTFFMMTGGAPGGTAGGMKVTVVALAFIGVWYTIRGDSNPHIFNRRISWYQINKAYAIILISSLYVVVSTVLLSEIEHLPFIPTLFEACSAFGTVGLSVGNGGVLSFSALFDDWGKLNIILLMFMGRVGVFAFTVAIIGKAQKSRIRYSEAKVVI